jgi:hypothetical protein
MAWCSVNKKQRDNFTFTLNPQPAGEGRPIQMQSENEFYGGKIHLFIHSSFLSDVLSRSFLRFSSFLSYFLYIFVLLHIMTQLPFISNFLH